MNHILEALKKARPNLATNSYKTYTSILRTLYKKVFPDDKEVDVAKFKEYKKFLDHLKDVEYNKRKTYLSALYIISKMDEYQVQMSSDILTYKNEQDKQEMNTKQQENWESQEQIKSLVDKYARNVKLILAKNEPLDKKEKTYYQGYIILCLYSGVYIKPRRLKDYTDFKFRNVTNKDNYFEIAKQGRSKIYRAVFNSYKTAKFHGAEIFPISKELYDIVHKYVVDVKPEGDYLLTDTNGKQLSSVKLNQRINRLFDGKHVGCNILRHSFVTEKSKEPRTLLEMQETAKEMGHSVMQQLLYVKNPPKETTPTAQSKEPKEKATRKVKATKRSSGFGDSVIHSDGGADV